MVEIDYITFLIQIIALAILIKQLIKKIITLFFEPYKGDYIHYNRLTIFYGFLYLYIF